MAAMTSGHSYLRVSQWFESVYTLQRNNLTNTSYVWPHRSHVWQLSTKSLLSQNWGSAPRMKSWLPAIVRPGRHTRLPHSPSTKPPRSRVGMIRQSSYWATRFTGPHKTRYAVSINQSLSIRAKMMWSLKPWNSHDPLPTLPSECSTFPYLPYPVTTTTTSTSTQHSQYILLVHEKRVLHASGTYHSSSTDGYQLSIAYLVA
jgi:hypothetical protein